MVLAAAGKTAEAPSWSHDGTTIFYDDARQSKLYSIHPDGTGRARVLEDAYGYYPAAGPDGTLAYTYDDGGIAVYVTPIPPVGNLPGIPVVEDAWSRLVARRNLDCLHVRPSPDRRRKRQR